MNETQTREPGLKDEALRWQAVVHRDRASDGDFVYAIRSTGIYCRPSCASRKPNRENVIFYSLPEIAESAGFRPCKRCQPELAELHDPRLETVQAICRFIQDHHAEPISLQSLGSRFALSPSYLQRVFKDVVGVSPLEYTETFRMRAVKSALRNGSPISDALYEAGFSSPSRLYDRVTPQLGMTPGRYKDGGAGMEIRYTVVRSLLGYLLVAGTSRGICAVKLGDTEQQLDEAITAEFPQSDLRREDEFLKSWVETILRHLDGKEPHLDLPLDIQATAFQKLVWEALQRIPYGETRTYQEVAASVGKPQAARAVAQACAANPVALVVPCHRVVRSDGLLGGYRWGIDRKGALLKKERDSLMSPESVQ